ncbi:hypothetical protein Bca52824_069642 [Brassica carinata]|uniref:Uncharacterized protein n=1 Tax=Brassica carinata TaxID=52824 RepID=A0A8X7Q6C5_BRACI|nr:hypothetical protein Bca52824_069642 [Brassica carinata]
MSQVQRVNLPPGPPGWPVVGNLFQFARSGKQFFEYVDEMKKIHGPILTLKMGIRTMIIISDADLAHQALIERGPNSQPGPSKLRPGKSSARATSPSTPQCTVPCGDP